MKLNNRTRRIITCCVAVLLLAGIIFGCVSCAKRLSEKKLEESADSTVSQVEQESTDAKTTEAENGTTATTDSTSESTTTADSTKTTVVTTKSDGTPDKVTAGLFTTDATYRSKHDYCIAVNTKQNIVIVYTKDSDGGYTKPYKAMVCSCGIDSAGQSTITGTYYTIEKYRWRYLNGGVYGQYATRINGHYLFHSVPYFSQDPSDLEYDEFNKLGSQASEGCVRLQVKDTKWIYDNCSLGTEVVLYSDASKSEPMSKPSAPKIDTSDTTKRGWDPTDPDSSNPWNN